ncbi:hypothetical protein [Pelosinus fermentans]|uniref:Uncharacterized protein n=1 Tax=Pelosinus fermentans JBW45 TaxID=1192197 RepID=I9NQB9_9FIRM|nr:hypothetical protein [Pelosinus fermentans]AJQ28219.1 hypothetical protein JBW_02876 [Pelosinus fermentans JBW45]
MEYRMLGRTGIKVSAIGIGGEGFENKSYEDCKPIIDCAKSKCYDIGYQEVKPRDDYRSK